MQKHSGLDNRINRSQMWISYLDNCISKYMSSSLIEVERAKAPDTRSIKFELLSHCMRYFIVVAMQLRSLYLSIIQIIQLHYGAEFDANCSIKFASIHFGIRVDTCKKVFIEI